MERNRLLELFPGEVEERLQAGQDLALVPVGSLEQHGPHLLLGTDGFWAQALAQEIGKIAGGFVLPPVPFSWVGCTNAFAGGVGVREAVFIAYLREVVKGLWKSGFRRILVVNAHGGNYYAMRSFAQDLFKEEGIPVLTTFGEAGSPEAAAIDRRVGGGENTGLAGALAILGRTDLLERIRENNRRAIDEFGDQAPVRLEPKAAREARRLGVVGHDYSHECLHVQPDSRLDAEAGAESLRCAAAHIARALEHLGAYLAERG